MTYLDRSEFKDYLRATDPLDLVSRWMHTPLPHAFKAAEDMQAFTTAVSRDYPAASSIRITGTANWKYSLNPNKSFSAFHAKSDIDVAIVSLEHFQETWHELRALHRKKWYAWNRQRQSEVLRSGQDVYCGFISPKRHIPEKANALRFRFLQRCNSYSTELVGCRDVNLMFFKCDEDVIDYYICGVRIARSKV